MSIVREARRLAQLGRPADAIALITRSCQAGDLEAMFILANWRLWGIYGRRDLHECHVLLEKAAAGGWTEAARLRASLVANGTGCPSDVNAAHAILKKIAPTDEESAKQLALFEAMRVAEGVTQTEFEELSADPTIRLVRKLLSPDECEYLIEKAKPLLRPSLVIDPLSRQAKPDPVRTSSGMNFDPSQEDLVVNAINRRIATVTDTAFACGEMLSILSYKSTEEYRPHVDALPNAANQRHITALIYLNDDYTAGETRFTQLGLQVRGQKGDCLIFRNATDEGRPDPRTRHAGLPVGEGVKWLASRWIRQAPHDPFAMQ